MNTIKRSTIALATIVSSSSLSFHLRLLFTLPLIASDSFISIFT